jgi:hypothetical protein
MRLNNGSTTGSLDYGAGGNAQFPQAGRWLKIYNATGADMFVPDNSTAEKNSTYNYVGNISGVTTWKGHAGDSSYTYYYMAQYTLYDGAYVCWSYARQPGSWNTPDGCPGGWTDAGVVNTVDNPNFYYGNGTLNNSNAAWMCYQVWGWGCGGSYYMPCSARICRK